MTDTTTAYRTPAAGVQDSGYRTPALSGGELGEGDNGRFNPSLPRSTHADPRYAERGYGNQNF